MLFLFVCACPALAEPEGVSVESATWRLEFDNDVFFRKDNRISNGWSLQRHSAVAESWGALGGVGRWGAAIPTLTKEGLVYRAGIAVGQVIQTPTDLSRSDLIEEDVPYAGVLGVQANWYAYNDGEFRGFGFMAGVVGPPSLAEQTQKTVHGWLDGEDPKGWDNQLATEPVVNATYMRKKKILRMGNPAGIAFDAVIDGDAEAGNLLVQAGASIEMRLGRNMPGGFVSIANPVGLDMHYKAALEPVYPPKASIYASLVLRGNAVAHNILLDGNTFHDSHSVDREPLVGLVIGGLHYERRRWSAHFCAIASTDNVDTSTASAAEAYERLGTIIIEWRF